MFSSSLDEPLNWPNTTLVRGDAIDAVRAMKQDGPTIVRDFLAAGLADVAHIVVVPILLGRGVRLWDGLEGLEARYDIEAVASPSGVTHLIVTHT